MPFEYCMGTSHVFIEIRGNGVLYLGTCEQSPQPQIEVNWTPLMNDIAGRETPIDMAYAGLRGAFSLDLTKWNEEVFDFIKSPPFYKTDGFADGQTSALARGSLMMQQRNYFSCWIVNEFWMRGGQVGADPGMEPGIAFNACNTLAYYAPRSGNVGALRRIEIGALDAWNPSDGTWQCWSSDHGDFNDPGFYLGLVYPGVV